MTGATRWASFARTLAIGAAALFLLTFAAIVVIDPYDTGRFALLRVKGVPFQTPRTANASRARDQSFDAAVFGNSHIQLLSPSGLSAQTGLSVVSLAVPATGPREVFTLYDYYFRHRVRPARAIVIGIDPYWCRPDPEMPITLPFPFWLYDPSLFVYLPGLVRDHALGDAAKRVGLALKLKSRTRAEPDGFWDYDLRRVWRYEVQWPMLRDRAPTTERNETGRFPALEALATRLDARPPGLAVVLVQPPVFVNALPLPGTALGRAEDACRAAVTALVAARPGLALVDWRVDREENRIPENFMDSSHYRTDLAQKVDTDVAAAIRGLLARPEAATTARQ